MKKFCINLFFVVLWTIMAIVLAVGVALVCAVRVLEPRHLTPLVEHFANDALYANVDLDRAELSFKPAFPFLHLDLDSITIISHAFDKIPTQQRKTLPSYADTLFVLDRFSGGINLGALVSRGELAFDDVLLRGAGLNIVLDDEGHGNFDIVQSSYSVSDTSPAVIPPFSIGRFAFEDPHEIRFFNAADSAEATIVLIKQAVVDGKDVPLYKLNIEGRLSSPITQTFINLDQITFGLDGRVRWEPKLPTILALEEFTLSAAFARAHLSLSLDFDSTLTISSAAFALDPLSVDSLVSLLPSDIRSRYRLMPAVFATDATVAVTATLNAPFCPGRDTIPHAEISLSIPECDLRHGRASLHDLSLRAQLSLKGNKLDDALLNISRFTATGPATDIKFNARLSNLVSDPAFKAVLQGKTTIANLPPIVADYVQGYLSGNLDMDFTAEGRMSMFDKDRFHALAVNGRINGRKLYYLSNDTNNSVSINDIDLRFTSDKRFRRPDGTLGAPTLGFAVKADTASLLLGGVAIDVSRLSLGAGVENKARTDTAAVVPLGGGINIGRLNILSITDSAGARIRDLKGHVSLRRFNNDSHNPVIALDASLRRLMAGTATSRLVLSQASLKASTHKRPLTGFQKAVKHTFDSLRQVHPRLSADSVYRLAVAKRRHKGPHRPRVHGQLTDNDTEVIEWGLSHGLRRYLTGWQLTGTLATARARVFTPFFPLRNRIDMLDIAFSTDSIELRGVRYRAGSSNLAIKGLVSNIRRSLTARRVPSPLKINMDVNSDTIDVNQIADAIFTGAAYAERLRRQTASGLNFASDNDAELDAAVQALVSERPDTVSPVLIPSNIDGTINLRADNILYSDLALKDFTGQILMFGGALNLHNLNAASQMGAVDLSALYSAPNPENIHCGMSLGLKRFDIARFLRFVPAVDSIMPLMRDFSGIVNANIAATVDIDSTMNLILPTLDAAINLSGDSLTIIDPETYRTLGKWLRFKNRADNVIKHVNMELIVRDNRMQLFPFSFNIDRYRLGVLGSNDLNMNFNYHISVLKSPLPFKFGINIKGNPDKFKVRFGGAKFTDGMVAETVSVVDTARVNLLKQIENVFRRGVRNSRFSDITKNIRPRAVDFEGPDKALSPADSLLLMQEGILPKNNKNETIRQ